MGKKTGFFESVLWGTESAVGEGAALESDAFEAGGSIFADADDFRVIDEDVVNEAAVVAVHGVERDGLAGGAHALGHLLDMLDEVVFANGAVVFDIDANAGGTGHVADEDAVHEVLDVLKNFTAASDQCIGIFGEDLKGEAFGSVMLFDLDGEAQVAQHRVENFASVFDGGHDH